MLKGEVIMGEVIKDFPKCPRCGCPDTVVRVVVQEYIDNGRAKKEVFHSKRRDIIRLIESTTIAFTVPSLVFCWDVCWDCGIEYITRIEKMDVPVVVATLGEKKK